ncbi:MAG: AAA family ATPase, partial [Anaerolineae bacterium]
MYLKRLELQGFKSFAGRTAFDFEDGITGIVGPNGAGKSNIADAIRWVLGEQSLKTLRARRGEDLIFAGSPRRPRVGMAEATLILDNSTDWLDIEFREVAIGRRAHRAGQSEYLLNGSSVRRQDIVELLAGAGVSTNAYTVIGQGLVDMALSMRSEERRKLLEEAAGIHVYQAKRNKAVRDLEQTSVNLQRVGDILREISPRLRSLERQARRSEKQRELAAALSEQLTRWHGYHWYTEQDALTKAQEGSNSAATDLEARKETLARAVEVEESTRAEEERLRVELRGLRQQREDRRRKTEDSRRQAAVHEERLRGLSERLQALETDLAGMAATQADLESRIRREETRLQGESEPAASGVRSEAEVKGIQDRAFRLSSRAAELRTRRAQADSRAGILAREIARDEGVLQELQEQREGLDSEDAEFDGNAADLQRQLAELDGEVSEGSARLAGAQRRADRAHAEADQADRALSRLQAKLETLEAAAPTSQDDLLEGEGALGRVTDFLRVPPELETAVARALGGLLRATVVETWDQGRALLRSHPDAKSLVVSLDSVRVQPAPEMPRDSGIIGVASRMVQASDRFVGLREGLLGRTVIVRDEETARRVHRAAPAGTQIVTVDGRVISSPGVLMVGVLAADEELLVRERKASELLHEITRLERRKSKAAESLAEASHVRDGLSDSVAHLEEARAKARDDLGSVEDARRRAKTRLHQLEQETRWRGAALKRARSEKADLSAAHSDLHERVIALEAQEKEALAQLDGSMGGPPLISGDGADAAGILSRERLEQAQVLLEQQRERLADVLETMEDRQDQRSALTAEAGEIGRKLAVLGGKVTEGESALDDLETRMDRMETELERLADGRRRRQQAEDGAREQVRRAEVAASHAQVEIERRKERISSLRRQIEADLEAVAGASALPAEVRLDVEARIAALPRVNRVP